MKHLLEKFLFCPCCGSKRFFINDNKSKHCEDCGFEYYMNASAANVAIIQNHKGEILVTRRKYEPEKGTLDLPGGFADAGETAEQGVIREVKEETNLDVVSAQYLFSLPNIYPFKGLDIPTLDMFFLCKVKETAAPVAHDDAQECFWLSPENIDSQQFGLHSIREGIKRFLGK